MKRVPFCLLLLAASLAADVSVARAQAAPTTIQVCKAADPATPELAGVIYNFTVAVGTGAPVPFTIAAGTAAAPNCILVGTAAAGTQVTVGEATSSPGQVANITVFSPPPAGATDVLLSGGGRIVTFTVAGTGGGTITVTFVNQRAPRTSQVNYVSGSGGTLRLLNPGNTRTSAFDRAPLCFNIYVYRPDEQLLACCSCPVTANGLRRLNVATNLLANPLQPPLTPPSGVTQDAAVKIVPTRIAGAGVCLSPGSPVPGTAVDAPSAATFPATALLPAVGLVSWATHVQGAAGTPAAVTETASQFATLTAGELNALQNQCAAAAFLGTGAGICTCGPAPASFFGAEEVTEQ